MCVAFGALDIPRLLQRCFACQSKGGGGGKRETRAIVANRFSALHLFDLTPRDAARRSSKGKAVENANEKRKNKKKSPTMSPRHINIITRAANPTAAVEIINNTQKPELKGFFPGHSARRSSENCFKPFRPRAIMCTLTSAHYHQAKVDPSPHHPKRDSNGSDESDEEGDFSVNGIIMFASFSYLSSVSVEAEAEWHLWDRSTAENFHPRPRDGCFHFSLETADRLGRIREGR
jgi:hypothetical protein